MLKTTGTKIRVATVANANPPRAYALGGFPPPVESFGLILWHAFPEAQESSQHILCFDVPPF